MTDYKPPPGWEHEREYALMSFWLEAILYGTYFTLFVSAIHGMLGRWRQSSKVFFAGMWAMFILTTVDTSFKGYTLLLAYGRQPDPESTLRVIHTYNRWDTFGHSVMVNVVVWIADSLAIYRCYIIWGRKWYIVLLPVLILMSAMAKAMFSLNWFLVQNPEHLSMALVFLSLCYPFNLAQNVITTGLISYKLIRQHRESQIAGLRGSTPSRVSLITVVYVIIESASIYTVLMLCLTIIYQTGHRSSVVLQGTIAPCASMVFVLMSVRMDAVRGRLDAERSFALPTMFNTSASASSTGEALSSKPPEAKEEEGVLDDRSQVAERAI